MSDDITIREATYEDVAGLIPRLRHYDKIEFEATGAALLPIDWVLESHAELYAVEYEGEVHAMFGLTLMPTIFYLTFLGTDEIFNHTLLYTRKAKAFIANRRREYFWLTPTVIIHPDNVKSVKWIKMMGFKDTGWKHCGLQIHQQTINKDKEE